MAWIIVIALIMGGFVWVSRKEKEINQLKKHLNRDSRKLEEAQAQLRAIEASSSQRIALLEEDLEKAIIAKGNFFSQISDELKSPLYTILGYTQMLRRENVLSTPALADLKQIESSSSHLLALLDDVLAMTQLETSQISVNISTFNIRRFLESLETTLQPQAVDKGLQLIFYITPEVPSLISTDKFKLRQVLLNLLDNALKFTTNGGVTLRIDVGDRDWIMEENELHTSSLFFEVEDSGCGIKPESLPHIFEPFSAHESRLLPSQAGAGLKLTIVRKLVHLMGGDISIVSEVNQGTIVKFNITIDVTHGRDWLANFGNNAAIIGLAPHQPTYRILVADDRADNRQLIVRILQPLGFEIREASNGEEAINIWSTWFPHLIWMDTKMPIMDGLTAVRQIRRLEALGIFPEGQDVPLKTVIIGLVLGNFEERQENHSFEDGYDDWIRKPFEIEMILETLAHYLEVNYLYEMEEPEASPDDDMTTIPIDLLPNHTQTPKQVMLPFAPRPELVQPVTAKVLRLMSPYWLSLVHNAAQAGDSTQLYHLLEQIPNAHTGLMLGLKALVDQFNFAKIEELTQVTNDDVES
jgi:signal transduction histidine kinase/FixJ family two-component response regulator